MPQITYSVVSFELEKALAGFPVALLSVGTTSVSIADQTGTLHKDTNGLYTTTINKVNYWCDKNGVVRISDGSVSVGSQFNIVKAIIEPTYGTTQSMTTRGEAPSGEVDPANISVIEPRDQFAISAFQTMISKIDHPELADDATILLYSRASYRWAQGMMIAAADARAFQTTTPTPTIDVNVEGGTNTEKLLNNIVASLNNLKTQSTADSTALKNALTTSLAATLKIDNPTDDKFEVEGGGGSSLSRDQVNDTGLNFTDLLVYNSEAGNAVLRTSLGYLIFKAIGSLTDAQEQSLYNRLKPLMDNDFAPLNT